jgi:hypothetical protein
MLGRLVGSKEHSQRLTIRGIARQHLIGQRQTPDQSQVLQGRIREDGLTYFVRSTEDALPRGIWIRIALTIAVAPAAGLLLRLGAEMHSRHWSLPVVTLWSTRTRSPP